MLKFEAYAEAINQTLENWPSLQGIGQCFQPQEIIDSANGIDPPQPLRAAMRYSLLLGGKRIRPVLLLMAYHMLKENWQDVLPYACAVEMIHTYSLIHDDLPALDNDSIRRGKPSNHIVFGENMAILAGDGLLNMAYETMLNAPFTQNHPTDSLRAIREIAHRAGVCGMIAGQTLDVALEGTQSCEAAVRYIHQHKTADLLTAPVLAGLMLAGASEEQLQAGETFGRCLGLCFQIVDDLLDVQGDGQQVGKTLHKDAVCGKQTWPSIFGIEESKKQAQLLSDEACKAVSRFGASAEGFIDMTKRLVSRNK